MSIFNVNHETFKTETYQTLLNKCSEIIKANKFLTGSLKVCSVNKQTYLEVDTNTDDLVFNKRVKNYIHEDVVDELVFDTNVSYTEKSEILSKYNIPPADPARISQQTANTDDNKFQNSPLFGIYLLRDHEKIEKSKKLIIIFSLMHLIGDGRTIFNLFKGPSCTWIIAQIYVCPFFS